MTVKPKVNGSVVVSPNNGIKWRVSEMTREEMTGILRLRGKYGALITDIEKRLEQTGNGLALCYEFA